MQATQPTFTPDFTLANPIPASYLAAGRLTFEQDGGTVSTPGTILWSLSWGGAGYTGPNTGDTTNDANGNFGPPYGSSLPTSGAQGIRFTGAATALSTTNLADYAPTANPATVVKNNGTSFVLPLVLTALETWRQTHFGTTANSGNAEITAAWGVISIRNDYEKMAPRIEDFLIHTGRRKFLTPLYNEYLKTPAGKKRAREIYRKARPNYHFVATNTFDKLLAE